MKKTHIVSDAQGPIGVLDSNGKALAWFSDTHKPTNGYAWKAEEKMTKDEQVQGGITFFAKRNAFVRKVAALAESRQHGPLANGLEVLQYCHCSVCLQEMPAGESPKTWARLSVGWTERGLQVWCARHECNVMNIDFEGQKHPANVTRANPAKRN